MAPDPRPLNDTPAGPAHVPAAIAVHAAGSLRGAFTDVAREFERAHGTPVTLTFGPSGLLKDRILGGESPQVFASANMAHPQALVTAGRASAVTAFARNALCVLAVPAFALNGKTLVQRLLDADVRLATATPVADPSGDYAFSLFDRIEATGAGAPGAAAILKARALQLTGGPNSAPPPAGRNVYAHVLASGQADVFVTYRTNAEAARREQPQLQVLPVPDDINVSALYGLAVLSPVAPAAPIWVRFLLGARGQAILASHGFAAPGVDPA